MRALILSTALILMPSLAAAASSEAPKRKSGLWEITVSSPQMPGGHTLRQCVDQNTDDMMRKAQGERMSCSKNDIHREGDKIVSDAVCQVEGTSVTTHTVFSGRFDSNYKADIKSTYNPPAHGMRETTSQIEGKWLGPCLAGQKPGDVIMPGMPPGMPGNMQDMQKGMKRPGAE
jgi:Protein of unknown function (DUF3617)